MINVFAVLGLCMFLAMVFSAIYIVLVAKLYDEEVEDYAGGIVIAVLMFIILSTITASVEISRLNLIEQIESMEGQENE